MRLVPNESRDMRHGKDQALWGFIGLCVMKHIMQLHAESIENHTDLGVPS